MKESVRKILDRLYQDIGQPHSLSTPKKLYGAARSYGISLSECKTYLNSLQDYTLHRNTRLNYPRNMMLVSGPRKILVSDIADMSKLSKHNDNIKHLLIVEDLFSRLAKCYPMQNKTGSLTAKNLEIAFNDPDFKGVTRLFVDNGGEYYNSHTKKLLSNMKIKQYSTHNTVFKTSLCERLIRTLKEKIYRYLTFAGTQRYIDILPKIMDSYNTSPHRTLHYNTPIDVHRKFDRDEIKKLWNYIYNRRKAQVHSRKRLLGVGTIVRVTLDRREFVFRKNYEGLNSREKFVVTEVDTSQHVPIYYLSDFNNEKILGRFYREELIETC